MLTRIGFLTFLVSSCLWAKPVPQDKIQKWAEKKLFVAKESTEATVVFDQTVEIGTDNLEFNDDPEEPEKGPIFKPSKERALNQIDQHLWHLFGPLSVEDAMYAAPKQDHQITNVAVTLKKNVNGTNAKPKGIWNIKYTYTGTMQVKNGPKKDFKITLPKNPDTIYELSKVGRKYPCTDDHYDSEDDFWYFWNPDQRGCKLKEDTEYVVFTPKTLDRIPNTKKSFARYPGMVDEDGVIRVSILMGLDEPKQNEKNRNPMTSTDINARTYRSIRSEIIEDLGFEPTGPHWTLGQIQEIAPVSSASLGYLPYVEEFVKEGERLVLVNREMQKVKIVTRLFFGPSGIDENGNVAFHHFFKDAIEKHAGFIYDGHSGLGGHLDLETIESENNFKIKFPKKKDQFYFFNSCSSYTYYNSQYFARKEIPNSSDPHERSGIRHLDILVNGLATEFDALRGTNMKLIEGINFWAMDRKVPSFQELAVQIDTSNLFSVSGDEDNPKSLAELGS